MNSATGFVITNGEGLYQLYNRYGRGRITMEQFIALYLEDELDKFIEKVKVERKDDE